MSITRTRTGHVRRPIWAIAFITVRIAALTWGALEAIDQLNRHRR